MEQRERPLEQRREQREEWVLSTSQSFNVEWVWWLIRVVTIWPLARIASPDSHISP